MAENAIEIRDYLGRFSGNSRISRYKNFNERDLSRRMASYGKLG